MQIGDLVESYGWVGVVSELNIIPPKISEFKVWGWSLSSELAISRAFNQQQDPLVGFAGTKAASVIKSPCHPLWNIKKDDLISFCGMYCIIKKFELQNTMGLFSNPTMVLESYWHKSQDEVILNELFPKNNPTLRMVVEEPRFNDVVVLRSPWNNNAVKKEVETAPDCVCKSLLYGCNCQYSQYMKQKRKQTV